MNLKFTEAEVAKYKLTESDLKLVEQFDAMMSGDGSADNVNMREFLATPSAQILIPRVIVGTMRQAAEPLYIGTKMLEKIQLRSGQSMVFPSIGVMRAADVAEGQEIPEDTIDWNTHETPEIRVGKSGIRVRVTEEMISDSQWDIVSMMVREAGRAMARHKEQKAFYNFSRYGHTVFDNMSANPAAKTTGMNIDGNLNDTMSAEDFLDIIIAVMNNEFTPSDILLHPLSWSVFAKNELMGSLAKGPNDMYPHTNKPGNMALGPESVAGRLPFAFNVQLSPFIPFDKKAKRFDMYVVDKNNIGVELVKEALSTEQFDEPARDIRNIKIKERYGIGILNEGRAIAVAKNISMNKSYNEPVRIKTVQ